MNDILFPSTAQPTEENETTLRLWLADIERMNVQIQQDQVRIVQLKAETEILRGETARLRVETRAGLSRLGEPL